jgi:ABC-type phosphate/phosphonate transport system substrate-binding protein
VPAPPIITHIDQPADLKEAVINFFVRLNDDRPDLARAVAHGETKGFVRVTLENYRSTIEARQELRDARRRRG